MFSFNSEVSEDELRRAFVEIDPTIPEAILDKYVSRGFHDVVTKADGKAETVSVIKKLQTGSVRRHGDKN